MSEPRRALILIDIQQEYVDGPLRIGFPEPETAVARVIEAIDAAEDAGIPIVVVQHTSPAGAPVFAAGTAGWDLHPAIAARVRPEWHRVEKAFASVLAGTGLDDWLRERAIDTLTLTGFMTNNCDLATAVDAEPKGFTVELLSDASGAIPLANALGEVTAEELHHALLVLLHSNFAAVATVAQWRRSIADRAPLDRSNLIASAVAGRSR